MLREFANERRKNPTPGEKRLAEVLMKWRIRFKREKVIGNYIADFVIKKSRLVIEVDGGYHFTESQMAKDKEKTAYFIKRGYSVLRITNQDAFNNEFLEELKTYLEAEPQRVRRYLAEKRGLVQTYKEDKSKSHEETALKQNKTQRKDSSN